MQGHASPRTRSAARALALLAVALAGVMAVVVGRALADPPILQSVELPLYQNHPTFHWTLPTGEKGQVQSEFLETATGSGTGVGGHFLQKNLLTFRTLHPTDTSFTDTREYQPGTYYVHIGGHDPKCIAGACEAIEFSNILSFDVVAPPPPGSGGGGGNTDNLAPLQTLSFSAVQDIDKLRITTRVSEAGTVTGAGTVAVGGAAKVYRFKRTSRSVTANSKATLRFKLSKKRLRAVKRALKKRKHLKAKLTVTVADKAGNKRSAKVSVGLRN